MRAFGMMPSISPELIYFFIVMVIVHLGTQIPLGLTLWYVVRTVTEAQEPGRSHRRQGAPDT